MVIQEAWIGGVSTRRVDELVQAMGLATMVAAAIRQAFLQAAHQTWRHVADQLRPRWPKLAALMDDSEHDVLAYMTFPSRHCTKLHSTNPLERLNKMGYPGRHTPSRPIATTAGRYSAGNSACMSGGGHVLRRLGRIGEADGGVHCGCCREADA
jgi:transposase-like protein